MALFSETAEREQNGAQITHVQHMRGIAVRENGSLLAMVQDFADGDATFAHTVERAPLRVRRANDGGGRMYPVPGDDTKWLYLGPPKVRISGTWTTISLGTPSRTGHTLTWTRPQSITTFRHGGHFADLQIELLGGFVPENNLIAFPVEINGLTRTGLNIFDGATQVARLRPFAMYDAANPLDRRPITQTFTSAGFGSPHLRLTLPSLTGMARPVIDPTLELQPDGTAGKDTWLMADNTDRSLGNHTDLWYGHDTVRANRPLIAFNLTDLPAAAVISATTLSLYIASDFATNARTWRVFRLKRAWVEGTDQDPSTSGATWDKYDVGGNLSWQTAGGFGSDDCEQTDIGTLSVAASETGLPKFLNISLTPVSKSALDLGNGWMVKVDTESSDSYRGASSDNATAANRPKLTVVYTEAATGRAKFFMHYARLRQ